MSLRTDDHPPQTAAHSPPPPLGIRSSLLLGFGAVSLVLVMTVVTALLVTARLDGALGAVLDERLPTTVLTFQVARAADTLAASGLPLVSASTEVERDSAARQIEQARQALDDTLADFDRRVGGADRMPIDLFNDLRVNIGRLEAIVDERIELARLQADARRQLLTNQLAFQQYLGYRVRILDGDGAVVAQLLARPTPPLGTIAAMAGEMAGLVPVPRFYGVVESINARALSAVQEASPAGLDTSRQYLSSALTDAEAVLNTFPGSIRAEVEDAFDELQTITLGENGILALRERELRLRAESDDLASENHEILHRVYEATNAMVGRGLSEIETMRDSVDTMRRRAMTVLVVTAALGLAVVVALMHFYVDRHIIVKLSELSHAMQQVAAGRLDIDLPQEGPSELGRLAAALRQFRTTARESRSREIALEAGNRRVEDARKALEGKTAELEAANAKLQELSVRDGLTGLFNRRRLDEVLNHEWARAGHGRHPLALIILDVDLFKPYNDRYGHQAGDDCLRQVAEVLQDHARRAGDMAARYGGEEFCLICPYTSTTEVASLAESIRSSVAARGISHDESPHERVTVSAGYLAAIPDGRHSARDLIQAADAALYRAKADGRNRTLPGKLE